MPLSSVCTLCSVARETESEVDGKSEKWSINDFIVYTQGALLSSSERVSASISARGAKFVDFVVT